MCQFPEMRIPYIMSQEINTNPYFSLCACFGLEPSSAEASVLIREAYVEPENAPRLPGNTDVVYYSAAPDSAVAEAPQAYAADHIRRRHPMSRQFSLLPPGRCRLSVTVRSAFQCPEDPGVSFCGRSRVSPDHPAESRNPAGAGSAGAHAAA